MDCKRIVTATVVLAICTVAGYTQKLFDTSRPDHFIEVGLHVADGMSSVIQNYDTAVPDVAAFSLTPGNLFAVGASAEVPIRNYLAIGTDFDFTVNNSHWTMTILNPGALNTLYTANRYYTFDIPFYASLRLNLGSKVSWRSEFGAYISLGLDGHSNTSAYVSTTNSLGQNQITEVSYHRDYYGDKDAVIAGMRDFDWGLHTATGIVVAGHYSLKVALHLGARNIAVNYGALDVNVHNINVLFKAGYLF